MDCSCAGGSGSGGRRLGQGLPATDFLHRFQLTPWLLSLVLGYFLPWFEIVTGIALFFRPLYFGALLAVSTLGALFAIAVARLGGVGSTSPVLLWSSRERSR